MTIILQPEQERLIDQAIQSGAYQNPHEVIERALEMLRSEDEWLHDNKEGISNKIERAFAQFERGEFLSAEQSRSAMEERKTAWLRDQPK